MSKVVQIPIEKINVLREALKTIDEILGSSLAGSITTERSTSKAKPRETKSQKVSNYKDLLTKGERVKKPNHLKS
jgi:hypothetical protein